MDRYYSRISFTLQNGDGSNVTNPMCTESTRLQAEDFFALHNGKHKGGGDGTQWALVNFTLQQAFFSAQKWMIQKNQNALFRAHQHSRRILKHYDSVCRTGGFTLYVSDNSVEDGAETASKGI